MRSVSVANNCYSFETCRSQVHFNSDCQECPLNSLSKLLYCCVDKWYFMQISCNIIDIFICWMLVERIHYYRWLNSMKILISAVPVTFFNVTLKLRFIHCMNFYNIEYFITALDSNLKKSKPTWYANYTVTPEKLFVCTGKQTGPNIGWSTGSPAYETALTV